MADRIKVGYAFCGSFCTLSDSLSVMERLVTLGYDVYPIMSENVYFTDTRFARAEDFSLKVERISGKEVIHTIASAEPLGPSLVLDALVVAPCTGNTLAKASLGITDTAVTMAAKAHLRQDRPLLIALASNDAMSQNLGNIARLITRRSIYFTPMEQDDPLGKPHSLVADFSRLVQSYRDMREGRQIRKMFI